MEIHSSPGWRNRVPASPREIRTWGTWLLLGVEPWASSWVCACHGRASREDGCLFLNLRHQANRSLHQSWGQEMWLRFPVHLKSFVVVQFWKCRWPYGSQDSSDLFLISLILSQASVPFVTTTCSHSRGPPSSYSRGPLLWCLLDLIVQDLLCSACQRLEFLSPGSANDSQPPAAEKDSGPIFYITLFVHLPDGTWQSPEPFGVIRWRLGIRLGLCPKDGVEWLCVSHPEERARNPKSGPE